MKTHNNATADRIIEILLEEINYVLKRNKTEEFLRSVLSRTLILEELRTEDRI